MAASSRRLLAVALLFTFPAVTFGDEDKDAAIAKDRKLYEGTWQAVSLIVNGNKTDGAPANVIVVENRSEGTWTIRVRKMQISAGTSTIDPTENPKTIDFTPTEGDAMGKEFLGIYELGENKRKLCFAPPGQPRPKEFTSTADNQHIVVEFERVQGD
jgi:uncharacterized protein (TIGR03067 family)